MCTRCMLSASPSSGTVWTTGRLDQGCMGRVHVAKQVLAAGLWYHATSVRPLPAHMQEIIDIIMIDNY